MASPARSYVAVSAVLVAVLGALGSGDSLGGTSAAAPGTVDALLATCPSPAEVDRIRADLSLSFEADPTAGTLVCRSSEGSRDLTATQAAVYQALRAMERLPFSRPLPWTSQNLYDWLVGAVDGVRVRGDIGFSFCCNPGNTINVSTSGRVPIIWNRWVDPQGRASVAGYVLVFTHEARHNQGRPHTCGAADQTIAELGAIGVSYYLDLWEALFTGSFLDSPDVYPSYYRNEALFQASLLAANNFCSLASADVSITVRASPDPVPSGSNLTYTAAVTNAGPSTAPEVFFSNEVPQGTLFVMATPSQGSCATPTVGATGPVGCSLGALAPGAAATVTMTVRVVRAQGSVGSESPAGAQVVASARDQNRGNNQTRFSTRVTPPPGCPGAGAPAGGLYLVGTAAADRLSGGRGRDVLCGLAGDDNLSGGAGRDILRGGPGADRLNGGADGDFLSGDRGDDRLVGGSGRDNLFGGDGRDLLLARDGARELVSCGAGRDVAHVDPVDAVRGDCEVVRRA